ncbi:MAG: M20 family metallo-hydrolase [Bacteroidetes bacterium]|nr:M20 family metallo-hydrolase [Bacteroidota bacterium]
MSNYSQQIAYTEAVQLLRQLIAVPSFSKEEHGTAMVLQQFLQSHGIVPNRLMNNVWATNKYYDATKPTLLLNSHHDTVKPNNAYTNNPFTPIEVDGKLFGLGSNDAGGSLVSLLATFLFFYDKPNLKYNLVFAASAEEEISGTNGIAALLPELGAIDAAIVGEPTLMQMAISEKGLIVLDCETNGIAGHAARDEGENAIYKSLQDITWFQNYQFPRVSDTLGPVKMSLTMINAGTQHNVVPTSCKFTVDVRVNDCYTNEEIVEEVKKHVNCNVAPRSMRLRSTTIDINHPLVKSGIELGKEKFGSSTLSDKALMDFPALKMGPGDSARSHTADEFIYLLEIEEGIDIYIKMLTQIL